MFGIIFLGLVRNDRIFYLSWVGRSDLVANARNFYFGRRQISFKIRCLRYLYSLKNARRVTRILIVVWFVLVAFFLHICWFTVVLQLVAFGHPVFRVLAAETRVFANEFGHGICPGSELFCDFARVVTWLNQVYILFLTCGFVILLLCRVKYNFTYVVGVFVAFY